jgi:hypothetical protein
MHVQNVTGVVVVVEGLHEVQDKVYEVPTVLVADQVGGLEGRWASSRLVGLMRRR